MLDDALTRLRAEDACVVPDVLDGARMREVHTALLTAAAESERRGVAGDHGGSVAGAVREAGVRVREELPARGGIESDEILVSAGLNVAGL